MLEKLEQTLADDCGLLPDSKLLVGISGGADSLSLLHALNRLSIQVLAGHFNHRLRKDAQTDADFVAEFAASQGIRYLYGEQDSPRFAEESSMSIEEAARELRYRFLFHQAEKFGVDAVVVAHTADDQVETVMMHLIRGTGLEGLCGMRFRWLSPWHSNIPLVRPFLGVWKSQIEMYCIEHDLTPRFDRSNLDTTFFRNKIRHDVLPVFTELNPGFGKLVWQTANILTQDQDFLQKSIQNLWENLVLESSETHVAFRRKEYAKLHEAARRRILRKAIEGLRPGLRDVGFDAVEYGLELIRSQSAGGQTDLIADLYIQIEGDRVIVAEWGAELTHPDFPQLGAVLEISQVPGRVAVENGWVFTIEELLAREGLLEKVFANEDLFTAYLDRAAITFPLRLRQRKEGDRFRPLGMKGKDVNLADFMINAKIPSRARACWPLVCSGEEIAWLPGQRISQACRVTENTEVILKLRFLQEG